MYVSSSSSLGRVLSRRGPCLLVYATAVALIPLVSLVEPDAPATPVSPEAMPEPIPEPTTAASPTTAEAPPPRLRRLSGIWSRYEPGAQGERVRFYYFHGDGTGLYRYGRVGLSNTHSFDYDVDGDTLVLDFRKTGEHHEVPFSVQEGPKRDWMELRDDPREPGATRYFRDSDEIVRSGERASAGLGAPPAGHMWIDLDEYATGGRGFVMYQFRPAGIDGRGVGWFHRGDFNDWSTEALTYRIVGDRIELHLSLEGRQEVSEFTVRTDSEGARWLQLADDPRDFWHPHRYVDMGPSFGAALAPWWLQGQR